MSLHPNPEPDPYSKTGALWFNGIIWSIMLLGFLAGVTAEGGPYSGLGGILVCCGAAFVGMVGNAGLCFWKLFTGGRYQAALYFIGLVPAAAVYFLLQSGLSHIGKIGG